MQKEYFKLTEDGRRMGDVLAALYRANKYVSIPELMELSHQDEKTVKDTLSFLHRQEWVERLVDDPTKWAYTPEARAIIEGMETRSGMRV